MMSGCCLRREHELPLEPSEMVTFPHSPLSFWKQKNRLSSQHEPKSKKQNINIDTQFLLREPSKLSKRGTKISEPENLKGDRTKRKTKLDAKISATSQLNFLDGTQKPPIGATVHMNAANEWSTGTGASSKLVQDIKKRSVGNLNHFAYWVIFNVFIYFSCSQDSQRQLYDTSRCIISMAGFHHKKKSFYLYEVGYCFYKGFINR